MTVLTVPLQQVPAKHGLAADLLEGSRITSVTGPQHAGMVVGRDVHATIAASVKACEPTRGITASPRPGEVAAP